MERCKLTQTVVVLDLDDTLYLEADYRASGLREVCRMVNSLTLQTESSAIQSSDFVNSNDPLAQIGDQAGLSSNLKESLLWIYRLHAPDIQLSPEVAEAVAALESACKAVAVLTDGRSVSQRLKLKALGLSHLPAYISEDYGSCKPEPLRFQKVMSDFPAAEYVYLGDNPKKDFVAPNALQWKTVGLLAGPQNIHSQTCDGLQAEYLPNYWVSSMNEFLESLC